MFCVDLNGLRYVRVLRAFEALSATGDAVGDGRLSYTSVSGWVCEIGASVSVRKSDGVSTGANPIASIIHDPYGWNIEPIPHGGHKWIT